jgi:spore germination cell wall hydrolase CwlJ-like protein
MVASRNRPKGAGVGPFGLSVLAFSLIPTQIGYQDVGALLIRQQDVSQRARAHALASPFGTIHAATFSFPRPVGTLIPDPPAYRLVSLNPGDGDVTGSVLPELPPSIVPGALQFPVVNRRLKGDLLMPRPQPQPPPAGTRDLAPGRVKTVSFPRPTQNPHLVEDPPPRDEDEPEIELIPPESDERAAPPTDEPVPTRQKKPEADSEPSVAANPQTYSVASLPLARDPEKARPGLDPGWEPVFGKDHAQTNKAEAAPAPPQVDPLDPVDDANPAVRLSRLYFGSVPVGKNIGPIESWPGDDPILMTPRVADPDIKRTALAPLPKRDQPTPDETVAPKGEVTGPDQRPKTPAERLGLNARERAKAEKCLAEAVYFESRGETKRGQIAVAQVVMNRVFSGYYPTNVCGVVYQNAHRTNACQFTFACDRIKDVVTEPDMWDQARQIARDTLDGKLWLSDIGKSTHYHAYWVHPWWVGTMRKLSRIGVHTFYRPRRWGDGSDAPAWGPGLTAANVSATKL